MPKRLIPEATGSDAPLSQQIKKFKDGANAPGINELPTEEMRKITHWIKLENWEFLKMKSAALSVEAGKKVTINMLLDQAVDLLKEKLG